MIYEGFLRNNSIVFCFWLKSISPLISSLIFLIIVRFCVYDLFVLAYFDLVFIKKILFNSVKLNIEHKQHNKVGD